MPVDMQKLLRDKDLIISLISTKGPSLPIHAARAANLGLLFASAFLSELYAEGKVKISSMKVGSSSLYYLPGQEGQLENFVGYLNPKEKEAFYLLKKEKILSDELQAPAIRVALRAIKDFAIPINVKSDSLQKLFWKHHLISDAEAQSIIEKILNPAHKKQKEKIQKPATKEPSVKVENQALLLEEQAEKAETKSEKIQEIKKSAEKKKKQKPEESEFTKRVKEYLKSKDIEIVSLISEKNKGILAVVKTNSIFGKQEHYLTAKDKKKATADDLTIALQKAQLEKMPALLLCSGELDKKAFEHANIFRNLIKFEKIN